MRIVFLLIDIFSATWMSSQAAVPLGLSDNTTVASTTLTAGVGNSRLQSGDGSANAGAVAVTTGVEAVAESTHIRVVAQGTDEGVKTYRVAEFGVLPDAEKVNTEAIQRALDEVGRKGGGVLRFESGDYVTGTIEMPSGVGIYLNANARILGSVNPFDYVGYAPDDKKGMTGLIAAENVSNIYIAGDGTIDGRGLDLALAIDSLHHTGVRVDPGYGYRRMRPSLRPKLLDFKCVDSLKVENVHLRGSAAWGLSLNKCNNVVIRGIDFVNRAYWNNDGIDVADCRNVLIEDFRVDAADDGIVLKSFDPTAKNENIEIRNCEVRSSASAFKIGTETFGGCENVKVTGLKVFDTFRSAIALETVDGAKLENIVIDGVEAINTGNAIFMRLGHRKGDTPGSFKNVTVRNLKCEIPFGRPDSNYDLRGPDINVIHNPFPSSITGIPDARIENVTLENIDITYPGRGTKGMGYIGKYRLKDVPEAIEEYPEFHMFGELPAWAFYIRHVDGLTLRNVKVRKQANDYRDAVIFDDVTEVEGAISVEP